MHLPYPTVSSLLRSTLACCLLLLGSARTDAVQFRAGPNLPATVIVDASDFLEHIVREDLFVDARALQVDWLYQNSAIDAPSQANLYTWIEIPEDGTYHLFVRSGGAEDATMKVAIDDQVTSSVFANKALSFENGGTFELVAGVHTIALTRLNRGRKFFDCLVLTKKAGFTEGDLKPLEFPEEVVLLKEYKVPRGGIPKFGDVDGDGLTDVATVSFFETRVYDHGGRELWAWEAPQEERQRIGFEPPGLIWDLDNDGPAEVIHYRLIDGREMLVVSDGRTGEIRAQTEWPTPPRPHVYNNFRLSIGRLTSDYPSNLIVFTDPGDTKSITAYTKDLQLLWQHNEKRLKDHLGHYVYPVDVTGDGIDEVFASPFMLDAEGKMIWNRFDMFNDNHDHADSMRFEDIDHDGDLDLVAPWSEIGVVAIDARTGEILWRHPAEHTQQLEVGYFLRDYPGPQIIAGARFYGNRQAGQPGLASQVTWIDPYGKLISKWPAHSLGGNPEIVAGDWRGDSKEHAFWHRFHMNGEGKGELYFPYGVYHMFDFMGRGAEEVIVRGPDVIQVYGSNKVKGAPGLVQRSPDYKKKMANHTHY